MLDFSDPKKIQSQIIATKWNDTHKTVAERDIDSIYKAPEKPLHINRSPNQLTTKSPKPKKKQKSSIEKHVKQGSNIIKQSKKFRKKKNHSPKSNGIHFVSGGLVRPK